MDKEKSRTQLATELMDKIKKERELIETESVFKDNKYEFVFKDNTYRVSIPTKKQRLEAEDARSKKYLELIQDIDFKLRDEWIKIYLKRGINIEAKEMEIQEYSLQINDINMVLAPAKENTLRNRYISQIDEIEQKQKELFIEVDTLLEHCIENRLEWFSNTYLAYLVLEKQEKTNEFSKAFENYEDFITYEDESLIIKTSKYLSLLMYRRIYEE